MLVNLVAGVGVVILFLALAWLTWDFLTTDEKSYVREDEYLTPRMKVADKQLRALSQRLAAEYTPGIVEWRSYATPQTLATSVDITPSPVWGFGSVVRKTLNGYVVEVTYGLLPLIPHETRFRAFWYVLAPRVIVTVPNRNRPLLRFDVYWTADEEVAGLITRTLGKAFFLVGGRLDPMPPEVERAHALLRMNASTIWCGKESVEVTGRPLPRAPDDTGEFGQGDFAVDAMVKMIEQTLAFVRTLEET